MVSVVGVDQTAVKRITCHGCASILEYTSSELKSRHGTDYGGGSDGCEWVDCPKCNKEVVTRSW